MGLHKFRNANYYSQLKSWIINDLFGLFVVRDDVVSPEYANSSIGPKILKSLKDNLSEDDLAQCIEGVCFVEIHVKLRYKLQEVWAVLDRNVKASYPKRIYGSELGQVFKDPEGSDIWFEETLVFFMAPAARICERHIRPVMLAFGVEETKVNHWCNDLTHDVAESLLSVWVFLYVTFDDSPPIPGLTDKYKLQ